MTASHETKGGVPQTDALRFRKAYGDGRRGGAAAASGREEGHEADLRRGGSASGSAISYLSRRLSSVVRGAGTSSLSSEVGADGEGSAEEARRSAEAEDARDLHVHAQRSARDKERDDAPRSFGGCG
jgi:hypothetical protein